MTRPLDSRIRTLGFCLGLATLSLSPTYAGSYGSATGGVDSNIQREAVRRQEDLAAASRLIAEGDRAVKNGDYETAYTSYMQAVDLIGTGDAVSKEHQVALNKFSQTSVAYAQWLIDNGKYGDAEKVAKTVLLPQYNPTYKPAIALLSNLEQPDYYNKTVTPKFAESRDLVTKLLAEAEGFYSRGSYDLATKRYEQVLNVDPYNVAARKGMEEVNTAREKYYAETYNETRARMLWQVSKGWEMPVPKYTGGKDTIGTVHVDPSRNQAIIDKLNRIVIPKLDFHDFTIRQAVDFLRQASRKLDTLEPDDAKRGVNIFLKLPSGATAAAGTDVLAPPAGALPGAAPGTAGAPPTVTEDTTITLSLNNIPLYEALRYVASQAGLKIKIDPAAVSIVPLTDVSQDLITKEYKVLPTFIPRAAAPGATDNPFGAGTTGAAGGTTAAVGAAEPTQRIGTQMNAKEYLSSLGIVFPEGASAQYIPQGSRLVVTNTQDNIDVIDLIVDAAMGAAPTQVQIESKFVEINQNNLKELGFNWLLGPFQIGNSGAYGTGGSLDPNAAAYPFSAPAGTVIGRDNVTAGLRSGRGNGPQSAISVNSIDALLGSASGIATGAGPAMFGLAGIFTNPQFQVVIRAMDQRKGIDLMSAPTVTTKSGNKAVINVVREFRYPTEFDPPQIPQTIDNGGVIGGGGFLGTTGFITNPIITPTTPSSFETRNIGVTLEVTPTVGADGYTIDLELAPEVVDFDGFINYGSPILTLASGATGSILTTPRSVEVSPNVINQPIFTTRKVTTNVTIWDGMTISLGGLIREDVQKTQDKVPFLGDVPIVGRLFRSNVDQKLKKNLIIFVTAKLIDAEGKPLRSDSEKEEIVEPLGLPDEIPPPTIEYKGSNYK
ncbi:MAG: Amuc_1098 family type IV pilus outer membrane protein [Chthoniobacterales bacterium]